MKLTQFARLGRILVAAAFALAVAVPAAWAEKAEKAERVAEVEDTEVQKPEAEAETPEAEKREAEKQADDKAGERKPGASSPCADRVFSRVFTPWHDRALYTLAPGGDFETAAEGWTLEGSAAIAADSSPFLLGEALGVGSLELAAGATAVSPPICVQRGFRSFRFVARSVAVDDAVVEGEEGVVQAEEGVLNVQVLYAHRKAKKAALLTPDFEWSPTRKISLAQGRFGTRRRASTLIRLRFAAVAGTVRVDDVYVDPRYHR